MSIVTEILDRLSGVAVVKEKLTETTRNVDRAAEWLLDHEKRIVRLESRPIDATPEPSATAPKLPRRR